MQIERLGTDDIEAALSLSIEAGWNQTESDWRYLITAGEAYGMRRDGQLVASVGIVTYGGIVGWICMMLVTQSERRRGHATRLIGHCLGLLDRRGVVAGLDATPAGREVYLGLGFCDVLPIARTRGEGRGMAREPMLPAALPLDLDRAAFGTERVSLLQMLNARMPHLSAVTPQGFCLARDGRTATQIGPVVATSEAAGMELIADAVEHLAGPVVIDVLLDKTETLRMLEDVGFVRERYFMRMLRGRKKPLGDPRLMMAIAGPEFA